MARHVWRARARQQGEGGCPRRAAWEERGRGGTVRPRATGQRPPCWRQLRFACARNTRPPRSQPLHQTHATHNTTTYNAYIYTIKAYGDVFLEGNFAPVSDELFEADLEVKERLTPEKEERPERAGRKGARSRGVHVAPQRRCRSEHPIKPIAQADRSAPNLPPSLQY